MFRSRWKLKTSMQVIIQIVPAQFFLEFLHAGVFVDQQEFDPGHIGKVRKCSAVTE